MHHDLLDALQAVHRLIDDRFQSDGLAPPVAHVSRDYHLGLGVGNAIPQSGVTEPRVHHGMNRSDASAGQHGDHAFNGQRHINDHPVAFHHAQ
jgi:hypothetical protein